MAAFLLPLSMISFYLLFSVSLSNSMRVQGKGIANFCYALCAWGLTLFVVTETLSVLKTLNASSLIFVWSLISALTLLATLAISFIKKISFITFVKCIFPVDRQMLSTKSIIWCIIFATVFLLMINVALYVVPYNSDSMNYHLTRIMQWTQNESVAHYATYSIRELTSPVFAEFVNLNIFLLSGNNHYLFNLVQCFSFIFCTVIVYFIAKKLGCNQNFCILASALCISMPIGLAEAFSTQVDDVSALWCVIFVFFIVDYFNKQYKKFLATENICNIVVLGLSFGLAYITKQSACIVMLCFALVLIVTYLKDRTLRLFLLKSICVVLGLSILIMLPEIARNVASFGTISDPIAGNRQLVGTINPLYIFINFFKNLIFNLPNNLFVYLDTYLIEVVKNTASILGVELNDPTISEDGVSFKLLGTFNHHHDTATNPIIVWSFLLFTIWGLAVCIWKKKNICFNSYAMASIISFIAILTLIRWEIFETRYEVPMLAILCPYIASTTISIANNTNCKELIKGAALGALGLLCIASLANGIQFERIRSFHNDENKNDMYFLSRPNAKEPMNNVSSFIKENEFVNIGMMGDERRFLYPFWPLIDNPDIKIRDVNVNNATSIYEDKSFNPEIVVIPTNMIEQHDLEVHGKNYKMLNFDDSMYYIFAREDVIDNLGLPLAENTTAEDME